MKYLHLFMAVCFLFVGQPIYAENYILNPEKVNVFYTELEEVQKKPVEDVIKFNDKHVHDEFIMNVKIPFADEEANTLKYQEKVFSKMQFFDSIKNIRKFHNGFVNVEIEVLDIKLNENKESATVKNKIKTEYYIEGLGQVFSAESCNDSISLIQGIIQIVKRECKIVAE